jgi:DNA sulfur modification protein DndD
MLLKKIKFINFRQFYGEQEIHISCDAEQNVTLIHGENGIGKTTILNALLWCFFKQTTKRFEKPEILINHEAQTEGNYTVKVEVEFELNGKEYLVWRELDSRLNRNDNFQAYQIKNGNFNALENPSGFIHQILPREMAAYFFFDGEFAESFTSANNKPAVKDALENMLGCKTANQAISDLKQLYSENDRQIGALTKGDKTEAIQQDRPFESSK